MSQADRFREFMKTLKEVQTLGNVMATDKKSNNSLYASLPESILKLDEK